MTKTERKAAALAAFRERRPRVGIYALRCGESGERWVGRATDLEAVRKRILFTLAHRGNPHRSLQAAWDRFGADAFAFEEVEILAEALSDGLTDLWLKTRLKHWLSELAATRI
jgi:hypothetical protein